MFDHRHITFELADAKPELSTELQLKGSIHRLVELVGTGRTAGMQAPLILDRGPKRWFFEKPYAVTVGERSE